MKRLLLFLGCAAGAYGFIWTIIEISTYLGFPILKDSGVLGQLILISVSLNFAGLVLWIRRRGIYGADEDSALLGQQTETPPDLQRLLEFEVRYLECIGYATRLIGSPFLSSLRSLNLSLLDLFVGPSGLLRDGTETLRISSEEIIDPAFGDRETFLIRAILSKGHTLIISEPGGGKSTLLQYIAHACCLPSAQRRPVLGTDILLVPILIKCEKLIEIGTLGAPIDTVLRDTIDNVQLRSEYVEGFFANVLQGERALLLIDGLDEVISQEQRLRIVGWIDDIIAAYSGASVIVATRFYAIRSTPIRRITAELTLDSLNADRALLLIERLWSVLPGEHDEGGKQRLQDLIAHDPHFRRMARSPLLLSMLVLLASQHRLQRSANVCSELLTHLLRRDEEKEVDWPGGNFEHDRLRAALGRLAYRVQMSNRPAIASDQALSELAKELRDTREPEFLDFLSERTGLLRVARGEVGFTHSLFRSYLVAEHLFKTAGVFPKSALVRWRDSSWRDIFLFYSELGGAASVVRRLEQFQDDLFYRKLLLQSECLARGAFSTTDAVQAAVLDRLFACALESPFRAARELAAQRIAEFTSGAVEQRLYQLALEADGRTASAAINILCQLRSGGVREILLNLYTIVPDNGQLAAILLGLSNFVDDEVEAVLTDVVRNTASPDLRSKAVLALAPFSSNSTATLFLDRLDRDSDADVRRTAAQGLERFSICPEPDFILDVFLRESDATVRGRLIRLMRKHRELFDKGAALHLKRGDYPEERWRAAEALAYLGTIDSEQALTAALLNDRDDLVRQECARGLKRASTPAAFQALISVITSKHSNEVRAAAVESLGYYSLSGAPLKTLESLATGDPSDLVQLTGIQALGKVANPSTGDLLAGILLDTRQTQEAREAAAASLSTLRSRTCVTALLQALSNDPSGFVRARCALSLRRYRSPQVLAALTRAVKTDEVFTVRAWAIESLRGTDYPEGWRCIIAAARSDPETLVRWRAIESVRLRPDPTVALLLGEIITNEAEPIDLRRVAVQSAAYTPDAALHQNLLACLQDVELADQAYDSLSRLSESPFFQSLGPNNL